MAALEELIQQISDEQLRQKISAEVTNLKRRTKFGLVFENHTPECLALYDVPIRKNSVVAKKFSALKEFYRVVDIKNDIADCIDKDGQHFEFALNEIVTVARFGDSIYPYLEPLDSICRAPDSDLWHILIEAENYHALQLLKYVCEDRKVDCIYIDPPYNTGARDWKYNNEYVDASDGYRHSKWLSMMERRLKLAKDILSDSGAIFISIDDNEQARLKLLCDEVFGMSNFVTTISNVNNPKGRSFDKFVATAHEYILVYAKRIDSLKFNGFDPDEKITKRYNKIDKFGNKYREIDLRKTGDHDLREDRPNLFYYFYYNELTGDFFPDAENKILDGYVQIKPVRTDGSDGCWRWSIDKAKKELSFLIPKYMPARKILGVMQKDYLDSREYIKPTNSWTFKDVNSERGTEMFQKILGFKKSDFPNPKPIGTIKRILKIATDKDALILDFFAGSGTTMHAVNLLNAEDGGNRRCILVTNNEVSEAESKALKKAGHQPGDDEWNKLGIARYVTWPRNVCAIKGENLNGEPLSGKYLGSEIEMAEGFKANAAFFKLDFLNKDAVELGREFKRLLPLLWLKAGGYGECPKVDSEPLPTMMILPKNKLAFLLDESFFYEFKHEIYSTPEIKTVFIISDTHYGFNAMAADLPNQKVIQLYKNYLVDFRLFIKG